MIIMKQYMPQNNHVSFFKVILRTLTTKDTTSYFIHEGSCYAQAFSSSHGNPRDGQIRLFSLNKRKSYQIRANVHDLADYLSNELFIKVLSKILYNHLYTINHNDYLRRHGTS